MNTNVDQMEDEKMQKCKRLVQINLSVSKGMHEHGDYKFANLPERLQNQKSAEAYMLGLQQAIDSFENDEAFARGLHWALNMLIAYRENSALDDLKRDVESLEKATES